MRSDEGRPEDLMRAASADLIQECGSWEMARSVQGRTPGHFVQLGTLSSRVCASGSRERRRAGLAGSAGEDRDRPAAPRE